MDILFLCVQWDQGGNEGEALLFHEAAPFVGVLPEDQLG